MQTLIFLIQDGLVYLVSFVVLLGILVFVHELGHFLVARLCGVKVEVFSLGFGKKIWKTQKGDTTYAVSIIPLGGYVKMFGEQPGQEIPVSEQNVSFTHKNVWKRIAIVLAGPMMNFFFAITVFAVVAMMGVDYRSPVLGDIEPGTKAFENGFRSGDRILKVAGKDISTFDDVADTMNDSIDSVLSFVVQRPGQEPVELQAKIESTPNLNPLSLNDRVGDIQGFSLYARSSMVSVPESSVLFSLGLKTGDSITKVNDQKITRWSELRDALTNANPTLPLKMSISRGDGKDKQAMDLTLAPMGKPFSLEALKIETTDLILDKVVPKSPAEKAGLRVGDRILTVAGSPVQKWEDVLESIKSYSGAADIEIKLMRGSEAKTVHVKPLMTSQINAFGGEDKRYTIGIMPLVQLAAPETINLNVRNPFKAIMLGTQQTIEFSVVTLMSFVRLFQNKISPKTIGGILSIGQVAGETMKLGFSKFLTMMAIISVNLFVLNLLPIPVLDGGHMVFYTIELIKGSPLSLKKMEFAQQIGMFLLMSLMVFALFNDVSRLFFGKI